MPEFFNRPPRIQPELPTGEVTIPGPPTQGGNTRQSLLQMGVPLITIGGYILVSASGKGSNPLFVLPMGLAVVASTIVSLLNFRKSNAREAALKAAYLERLTELRTEMLQAHDQQRAFYLYSYPAPDTAMAMAGSEEDSHPDPRLWERRTGDDDFGAFRIGVGTMPTSIVYKLSTSQGDLSGEESFKEARKLEEDSQLVDEVPIIIPLAPRYKVDPGSKRGDLIVSARHAIGIAGDSRDHVTSLVRGMLTNFAAFHAPTDARLYVVCSPDAKSSWDWARWLPHCNTSRNESRAGSQLAFESGKVRQLWDTLQTELERRQLRLADADNKTDVTVPFLMVVIDALSTLPGESPLKAVEAEAAVSMLLHNGPELGAAILFLVPDITQVPSECRAVIEVASVGSQVAFRYAEVGINTIRYDGIGDTVNSEQAEVFARRLAPMAVRTTYGADLAQAVSMLELFQADSVDQLPILENWR